MSHSSSSKIGVIDTGDMVIVRSTSKMTITTYLEGHETGYSKFGDHGDVILYEDAKGRTIIHRAILYVERQSTGWYVCGLEKYTGGWSCGALNNSNYKGEPLTGTLVFTEFGFKNTTVSINLDDVRLSAAVGTKGYVTMGDNNNPYYDTVLVTDDMVVAIATQEIPWIGCIKLYATGTNIDKIPSNSLPLLIASLVAVLAVLVIAGLLYERRQNRKKES
jgi:signal peptidase